MFELSWLLHPDDAIAHGRAIVAKEMSASTINWQQEMERGISKQLSRNYVLELLRSRFELE